MTAMFRLKLTTEVHAQGGMHEDPQVPVLPARLVGPAQRGRVRAFIDGGAALPQFGGRRRAAGLDARRRRPRSSTSGCAPSSATTTRAAWTRRPTRRSPSSLHRPRAPRAGAGGLSVAPPSCGMCFSIPSRSRFPPARRGGDLRVDGKYPVDVVVVAVRKAGSPLGVDDGPRAEGDHVGPPVPRRRLPGEPWTTHSSCSVTPPRGTSARRISSSSATSATTAWPSSRPSCSGRCGRSFLSFWLPGT